MLHGLLRVISLSGKFLFILFITKEYNVDVIGEYGLIVNLLSISIFIIGCDYQSYAIRRIVQLEPDKVWQEIVNSLFLYFIFYILYFSLFSYFYHISGLANSKITFIVFTIIILEHLCQEIYRVLIALNKTTFGNIFFLIKSGFWCYIVIITSFFVSISFLDILRIWLLSLSLAVIIGALFVVNIVSIYFCLPKIKCIFIGLNTSFKFFLSTLIGRSVYFYDKILIASLGSSSVLASYVFFNSVVNAVQSLIEASIISKEYPKILKLAPCNTLLNERMKFRKQLNIYGSICFSLGFVFLFFLCSFIYKDGIYYSNLYMYFFICVSMMASNFSYPEHYLLYGKRNDNILLMSSVVFAFSFFSMYFILFYLLNNYFSILFSLFFSSVMLSLYKIFYVKRVYI